MESGPGAVGLLCNTEVAVQKMSFASKEEEQSHAPGTWENARPATAAVEFPADARATTMVSTGLSSDDSFAGGASDAADVPNSAHQCPGSSPSTGAQPSKSQQRKLRRQQAYEEQRLRRKGRKQERKVIFKATRAARRALQDGQKPHEPEKQLEEIPHKANTPSCDAGALEILERAASRDCSPPGGCCCTCTACTDGSCPNQSQPQGQNCRRCMYVQAQLHLRAAPCDGAVDGVLNPPQSSLQQSASGQSDREHFSRTDSPGADVSAVSGISISGALRSNVASPGVSVSPRDCSAEVFSKEYSCEAAPSLALCSCVAPSAPASSESSGAISSRPGVCCTCGGQATDTSAATSPNVLPSQLCRLCVTNVYELSKCLCVAHCGRGLRNRVAFSERLRGQPWLLIDCDFDELHSPREAQSLQQQLMYSYGAVHRAKSPMRLALCGVSANLRKEIHKRLSGVENWQCFILQQPFHRLTAPPPNALPTHSNEHTQAYTQPKTMCSTAAATTPSPSSPGAHLIYGSSLPLVAAWDMPTGAPSSIASVSPSLVQPVPALYSPLSPGALPRSVVYLTADSPNVLETLEADTAYVVGGLVDRNRHKGLTYKLAEKHGIATANLPIREHLELNGSKVLTVNQVVDILLSFNNLRDWAAAVAAAIPERKCLPSGGAKKDAEHQPLKGNRKSPGRIHALPSDGQRPSGGSRAAHSAASTETTLMVAAGSDSGKSRDPARLRETATSPVVVSEDVTSASDKSLACVEANATQPCKKLKVDNPILPPTTDAC
eukprot:GHVT01048488.1.p1 GENE.GHVT01048488.1~~GHVT01048488.1.p1  ORF type:complete len:778 (+),score=115.81 GHVT01048488.1:1524-3857(+)